MITNHQGPKVKNAEFESFIALVIQNPTDLSSDFRTIDKEDHSPCPPRIKGLMAPFKIIWFFVNERLYGAKKHNLTSSKA